MVKTLRIVDLDQSDRSEQSENSEHEQQHRVAINTDHPDKKKRTPNPTVHAELKQTSKLRKSKPKPAALALQKSMETISPLPLRLPLPRTLELPIPVAVPLFSPSMRHWSNELNTKLDPEQQLLVPQVDPELQPVLPLTDPELQPTNQSTGDSEPSTPREQLTKAQEEEIQIITVDDNPRLPSHSTSSEVAQPSEEVEQKNIAEIAEILVEFNTSSASEQQLPPIKQLESFGNDCDSWLSHLTARQIQQLPPIHITEEDYTPSEYRCRSFSASAYSSSYYPSFLSEKRSMSFDSLNLPESTQVSFQGQKEHKGASKLNSDSYFLEDVDAEMNQQTPNQVALQIDLEGNLITNWEQNVDHQLEAQSYEIYNQNHQNQLKYFDEPNNINHRLNNTTSDNHFHHRQGGGSAETSSNENFSLIDLPTDENIDSFLNHGSLDDISLDHLQQFSNQHFSETPSATFHTDHNNSTGMSSQNQLDH